MKHKTKEIEKMETKKTSKPVKRKKVTRNEVVKILVPPNFSLIQATSRR